MATYYVRPDGLNTNPGTGPATNQAWATITKAAGLAVSGDIIYIAPGIYREQIAPANSGTSTNSIKYNGDPWAAQFPDMTPGAVIVSGLIAGETAAPSTSKLQYNIIISNKNYLEFRNFEVQHNTGYVFNATSCVSLTLENIVAVKGIKGFLTGTSDSTYGLTMRKCFALSPANTYLLQYGGKSTIEKCILKSQQYLFYMFDNQSTNVFRHCILEGIFTEATTTPSYQKTFTLVGCYLKTGSMNNSNLMGLFNTYATNWFALLNCELVWDGSSFNTSNSSNHVFRGTRISGIPMLVIGSNAIFNYCDIFAGGQNCVQGFYNPVTMTGCYLNGGTIGAVQVGSGAMTLTNPIIYGAYALYSGGTAPTVTGATYVEPEGGGTVGKLIRSTGAINGVASLIFKGDVTNTEAQVHVVWIPCKAGVPTTVKIKMKKTFNDAVKLPAVEFGTTRVEMANNTNVQDISATYTHYKTELVPFFVLPKLAGTNADSVMIDDIKVA